MTPDYIVKIKSLEMGETLTLSAADGDTVEALYNRVKQYLRRAKLISGNNFKFQRIGSTCYVTRVEAGQHKKLAHFKSMKAGERVYYSDGLDEVGYRRLHAKLNYLRKVAKRTFAAERDPDGKIYLRCHFHEDDDQLWAWDLRQRGLPVPRLDIVATPEGKRHDLLPERDMSKRR